MTGDPVTETRSAPTRLEAARRAARRLADRLAGGRAPLWLTGAVILCGFVAAVVHFHDYVFDDAYITYRFAQNAAAGNGLVFNPGSPVLGTSSPLQALLLTVAGVVGLDIAATGAFLYALFWTATAALGALVLGRVGSAWAGALFAAWMFLGLGNLDSYWGMETTLYISLMLLAVHCARHGRDGAAGASAGLAILARYDGGLLALVLAALIAWRERRFPLRYAIAGTAVVLPWLVFAQLSYGSFLPQTLAAKAGTRKPLEYMATVLEIHVNSASPLARAFGAPWTSSVLTGLFALLIVGGVFHGLRRLVQRDPWSLAYGATAVLLWVSYGVIGPPSDHHWHMAPAAVLAGLFCVACWVAGPHSREPRGRRPVALALVAVLLALVLVPASLQRSSERRTGSQSYRNRAIAYAEMADWLVRRDLDHLTVLTAEPGYLAYLSGNPVVDLAGLVTPGLFFHGPNERRTSFMDALDRHEPDLVVLHPGSDPSDRPGGYVDVFSAFASRRLVMREDRFEEHFSLLTRPPELSHQPDRVLRGEWTIDVDSDLEELRRLDAFLPAPSGTKVGDEPVVGFVTGGAYSPWEGMETPPFLVDFDRLELEFQGTHSTRTVAQLVVDGRVVFEAGGLRQWHHGRFPELQTLAWPVSRWRGHVARVRFVDVGPSGNRILFTRIRSLRDEHTGWEDFEDEPRTDRWLQPLPRRESWRSIALDRGLLAPAWGQAASTLGVPGPVEHQTRPFPLPASLGLILYDVCPSERCVVQLIVGDKVRRELRLTGEGLTATVWGMQRLEGRPGILRLLDHDPDPDRGFAIDDLTFRVPPNR